MAGPIWRTVVHWSGLYGTFHSTHYSAPPSRLCVLKKMYHTRTHCRFIRREVTRKESNSSFKE